MNKYIATNDKNKIILVIGNEIQHAINPKCKEWREYEDSGQELIEKQPTSNHTFTGDGWVFSEELKQENERLNLDKLRTERDTQLVLVDSYQGVLRYKSLMEDQQVELSEYRQALLDAPESGKLPEILKWL